MKFLATAFVSLALTLPALAQDQPAPAPAPTPAPNSDQNSDQAVLEQCRGAIMGQFPDDQSRHKALLECAISAGPKIAMRIYHCAKDPKVEAITDKKERDIAILDCLEGKPVQ